MLDYYSVARPNTNARPLAHSFLPTRHARCYLEQVNDPEKRMLPPDLSDAELQGRFCSMTSRSCERIIRRRGARPGASQAQVNPRDTPLSKWIGDPHGTMHLGMARTNRNPAVSAPSHICLCVCADCRAQPPFLYTVTVRLPTQAGRRATVDGQPPLRLTICMVSLCVE